MNKRKLSYSLIIIMLSVILCVTGTYAWFTLGRLAQLGDLGLTVIEAGSGVEVQGSANTAYIASQDDENKLTLTEWGKVLKLDNFKSGEFLPVKNDASGKEPGKYSPVSPARFRTMPSAKSDFIKVGVKQDVFVCAEGKAAVDYNDFSINLRSETENPVNVEMKINIHPANGAKVSAVTAGRVAVTYKGITKVFALNDSGNMNVVSQTFANGSIKDTNGNRVIDGFESSSVLSNLNITKLEVAEDDKLHQLVCTGNMIDNSGRYIDNDGNFVSNGRGFVLNGVSGNKGYSTIYVQTWIEGNDTNCIDYGENSIASGSFIVDMSFAPFKG